MTEARSTLTHAWGAPVANAYGMSEGLFTGSCGHGMHLPDDLCLVEPVDAAGRPIAPGATSRGAYLTNLYNHTLPLIRFEVSDEVAVLEGACPCGSPFTRIGDPLGRVDDTFVYPGGVTVHPLVFWSALRHSPQIVEYQVRQTPRGADVLVVTEAPIDAPGVAHRIEKGLAGVGLAVAEARVTVVEALDRQASGKLKRFVPLAG